MAKKEISKAREELVAKVIKLFEGKELDWTKGWGPKGNSQPPANGITGRKYRGINNALLWLVAMERGYNDHRWVTFNQIKENGWQFKRDAEGNTLGKGAGVPIEMFRVYDKLTKKDLDFKMFKELTLEERLKYWKENVKRVVVQHTLFNGDIIEGFPKLEQRSTLSAEDKHEQAERVIRAWNDRQCKITHDGGMRAYYAPKTDDIHLPEKTSFVSLEDYYGTTLHEIGHATGHSSRLNRDLTGGFGSEKYAKEELRAEFASMFMQQELGLPMSEHHVKNHTAYLQSWSKAIKENSNVLFDAVKDATKMSDWVFNNAAALEAAATGENSASASATAEDAATLKGKLLLLEAASRIVNKDMDSVNNADPVSEYFFYEKEECEKKLELLGGSKEAVAPSEELVDKYAMILAQLGAPYDWDMENVKSRLTRYMKESEAAQAPTISPQLAAMVAGMQPAAPYTEQTANASNSFLNSMLGESSINKESVVMKKTELNASPAVQVKADRPMDLKMVKWKKGWTDIDVAKGRYVETSYEWFDFVPDMHLMKSKVQDVWYIGEGEPQKAPKAKCLFFDENSAKAAFEQVREFQRRECYTRGFYEVMDINELREWKDRYSRNPVTQKDSVWLSTVDTLLEKKETESAAAQISKISSQLADAVTGMQPTSVKNSTAEELGAVHKPVYPTSFEDIEIPSYAEQIANMEDPFVNALIDEL